MSDKLPLAPLPDLVTAVQGEAISRPVEGTSIGKRTEKLNDELRDTSAFRELKIRAEKEQWTRERFDEAVRALGIR